MSSTSSSYEFFTLSITVAAEVKGTAKFAVLNELIREFRFKVLLEMVRISSKLYSKVGSILPTTLPFPSDIHCSMLLPT